MKLEGFTVSLDDAMAIVHNMVPEESGAHGKLDAALEIATRLNEEGHALYNDEAPYSMMMYGMAPDLTSPRSACRSVKEYIRKEILEEIRYRYDEARQDDMYGTPVADELKAGMADLRAIIKLLGEAEKAL